MESPVDIDSEAALDALLSRPSRALTECIRTVSSPLVVLGAGGKMGPTLCVMARRAAEESGHRLDVVAVSRFQDPGVRRWLQEQGVKIIQADLLEAGAGRGLPDAENLVYMVGRKFGTGRDPATSWAVNTLVPLRMAERYPKARMVALSTGNVYPLAPVAGGGSTEAEARTPLGEYANTAVARERLFEYEAQRTGLRVALIRLFYAVELRYGVVADLARHVNAGLPIPLANGWFNCIWQSDANDRILRALSLASAPPSLWNLCRPEAFSVRDIAAELGALLGRPPVFAGAESDTALLGNAAPLCRILGTPPTPMRTIVRWVARWVKTGGRSLEKPTHFEVRDGDY